MQRLTHWIDGAARAPLEDRWLDVDDPAGDRIATDGRYLTQVAEQVPDVEPIIERSAARALVDHARAAGAGRVGFEADTETVTGHRALSAAVGDSGIELVSTTGVVQNLRAVKEPGEIELLRAACAIGILARAGAGLELERQFGARRGVGIVVGPMAGQALRDHRGLVAVIPHLAERRFDVRLQHRIGRITGLQGGIVGFADGTRYTPEVIVWATGYRHADRWIRIPAALDPTGVLHAPEGVSPVAGLYTIGRSWQRNRGSALLGFVSTDAAPLARTELGYIGLGAKRITLTNVAETDARVILLGGAPLAEDIVMWWNFIGRSHDEIEAFRSAYEEGSDQFGEVPGYYGGRTRIPAPPLPPVRLRPRNRRGKA